MSPLVTSGHLSLLDDLVRQSLAASNLVRLKPALLWALGSAFYPGLEQLPGGFLGSGGWLAAFARTPSPSDKVILRHMLLQHRKVTATVTISVFQLPAYLSKRFPFPRHG